jgi:hypothetical protein
MIKLDYLLKLVSLEKSALQAASRFSGLPKLGDEVEVGHAVCLILCDLLNQKGVPKDHQYAILDVIKDDITKYVADPDNKFLGLQILDYTYVALPGWEKPYNYQTLEYVDRLPHAPILSDCIAVTAIYDRMVKPLILKN